MAGFLVMAVGLFLLSRLAPGTGFWAQSGAMFGIGIGLSKQVLTIIVQNTARYADHGVATSVVTFFWAAPSAPRFSARSTPTG